MIHPVILSGGSGTRLWPMSRTLYPKQLLSLLGRDSLLQQTVRRVADRQGFAAPVLVANEEHRFIIAEQLREIAAVPRALLLEPVGRNTAPATCIAAWTPIDDADLENGCLYVVPGSHKGNILCPESKSERWFGYGDSHISQFPREAKPIAVPVTRGQTIFFGGNLIHGSGPNRTTDRYRRTFIGHYVSESSDQLSKFYHPVLNMKGEVVSHVAEATGGGPCGDEWKGSVH